MTPIGETLRRERVRRNLDLEEISRELKIAPRFLEAIEQEKFDRLPGPVFAKSFVRQYARLLGLDADELAAEVQRQFEPPPGPPAAHAPELPQINMPRMVQWETIGDGRGLRPSWSAPLISLAMVVIVMLGCAALYTWWSRRSAPAPTRIAQTARPPAQPALAPQPASTQPQAPAQTAADQGTPPPAGAAGSGSTDAGRAEGKTAGVPTVQTAAAPQTPQAEAPTPQLKSNASVQVEMIAQEPVWVRAQSDGKYLFSGTLQANESRKVDAEKDVQLRLGNAGGVTFVLNGKPVGPVGPKGQVRTVQFTPGGFKIVSAPSPAGELEPF